MTTIPTSPTPLSPSMPSKAEAMSATASIPTAPSAPIIAAGYRNHGAEAKRDLIAAALIARDNGDLSSVTGRSRFIAAWAERTKRSERTARSWMREALNMQAPVAVAPEPAPDLLDEPPAVAPPVSQEVVELPPAPEEALPLVAVPAGGEGVHLLATALPLDVPAGEREAWWEVPSLMAVFGAAFDLSRCQVPPAARRTALLRRADAEGSKELVRELMRGDGVLLVLACNVVDAGAAHWFGEAVRGEYALRFAEEEAQAIRKAQRCVPASTPCLATASGVEVQVFMEPDCVRIDAAAAFSAFFDGEDEPHLRFGIEPKLRPQDLFVALMPHLGQAPKEDGPKLGDLTRWLATSALPMAAAMDKAAGR